MMNRAKKHIGLLAFAFSLMNAASSIAQTPPTFTYVENLINTSINSNGSGGITGPILNNVLQNMLVFAQYPQYNLVRSGNTYVFATSAGTLVNGHCVAIDANGNLVDAGAACGSGGGGSGTVTNVGLALPSSVFTISGSPVTASGTLTGSFSSQTGNQVFAAPNGSFGVPAFRSLVGADIPAIALGSSGNGGVTGSLPNANLANSQLTIAGHSVSLGGSQALACADLSNAGLGCSTATGTSGATIPLLNGANTWSSAQTLSVAPIFTTLSGPLIGHGASALTAGSLSGNTTVFGTTSGTLTTGDCVSINAGNLVDAGGPCTTGGGGGTVNSGTVGQLAFYGSTGTAVSGNADATISVGALTLGIGGSAIGSISLANTTSGATKLNPSATASNTLTLPAATDTLAGIASTQTLTNKTISGSSNTLSNIANASLTNSATTVNGQTCTLGSTCTIATGSGLTVGTTTITGGTSGNIESNNAGVLGEIGTTGSGNVVRATSPTIAGPTVTGAFTATGLVTNADLANASITVSGTTCTLGSTCSPAGGTPTYYPPVETLVTSTGTYTTPTAGASVLPLYLEVDECGGGGGGGGGGFSVIGGAGGNGGTTTFNSISALGGGGGGGGGGPSSTVGVGGVSLGTGTGTASRRIPGGGGTPGNRGSEAYGSRFGTAGTMIPAGTPVTVGGFCSGGAGITTSGGGAKSEEAHFFVSGTISSSYSATIGAAGSAGTPGDGAAGGPGTAGVVDVIAHWQ